MYIIRDIFYLKFGHYRDAKELLDEAFEQKLMPEQYGNRVLQILPAMLTALSLNSHLIGLGL